MATRRRGSWSQGVLKFPLHERLMLALFVLRLLCCPRDISLSCLRSIVTELMNVSQRSLYADQLTTLQYPITVTLYGRIISCCDRLGIESNLCLKLDRASLGFCLLHVIEEVRGQCEVIIKLLHDLGSLLDDVITVSERHDSTVISCSMVSGAFF